MNADFFIAFYEKSAFIRANPRPLPALFDKRHAPILSICARYCSHAIMPHHLLIHVLIKNP